MPPKLRKIITAFLVFVVAYTVFLAAWVKIRHPYGHQMSLIASYLISLSLHLQVEDVNQEEGKAAEKITLKKTILTDRAIADLVVDQTVNIDSFTFNVPLTAALLVVCMLFMRLTWFSVIEGALIIAFGHLLYLYSYLMFNVQKSMIHFGCLRKSPFRDMFWEFIWSFTDNLLIRFEPFLVIVIIWLIHGYGFNSKSGN